MRYLTFEEVVAINRSVTGMSGEEHFYEAEDERRLREILNRSRRVGHGVGRREALVKKAAYLLYSIAASQPFHEGNKRTAHLCAKAFLKVNGYTLRVPKDEAFNLLEGIARYQAVGLREAESFIRSHVVEEDG